MYSINVSVSFAQRKLTKKDLGVTEGDYNTTKLVFDFDEDVSNKTIMFEMSNSNGELVMTQELPANHEIVLTGEDDEGRPCSLFGVAGLYPFELIMISNDSRISSATGWLTVNQSHVDEGGVPFGGYFPPLMEVITRLEEIETILGDIENTLDSINDDMEELL